jgi:hypothetical protein
MAETAIPFVLLGAVILLKLKAQAYLENLVTVIGDGRIFVAAVLVKIQRVPETEFGIPVQVETYPN